MNPKTLSQAISSAQSVKLGLASNPESSSAWVKTLIDPAHAREYGCRGIPDENQQPTLVLNGRDTQTYYSAGQGTSVYYTDASSESWIQGTVSNIQWTSVTFLMTGLIERPYYYFYRGIGEINGVQKSILAINYSPALVARSGKLSRIVAQSATLSWVAQEINKGGYIEAGYWLPSATNHSSNATLYVDIKLDDLSNLATYTAGVEEGCYAVSSFNDYDTYRYWKGRYRILPRITLFGKVVNLTGYDDYCNPQGFGGMRPYFITFHAYNASNTDVTSVVTNPWGLRLTTSQVVEVMAAYSEGGSDAAVYDRASVEDMIALYDSMDLIFPARYNDWKKVWSWIKSNAPKAISFASSVMRHFPHTRSLGDALGMLTGDLPKSYALMSKINHLAPTGSNLVELMPGGGSTTQGQIGLTKKQRRARATRNAIVRATLP